MHFIDRSKNESIIIAGQLRVTILEVHDDEVTVSIESNDDPAENRIETLRVATIASERELVAAF